ncbi:uncharacterized protein AB675_895 [Cyphellophora attinorum]|uniref:Cyclochlorotine biosynthesis protein O n=1 Tax=Cyphellophora attinorum TaxID=1664694 RepID=A0A0N1P4B8_9EURO|nr:uncharacterized protein AB675_895 [Phialophora attinorum]KPI45512.1 hypothetical protein AB675_895 [Phialophora attinorum]
MDDGGLPFEGKAASPRRSSCGRHPAREAAAWLIVAALCAYIMVTKLWATDLYQVPIARSSVEGGSDFASARSAIKHLTTQFTSSLEFRDSEHIYRVADSATPAYIGNSSKQEIDSNWDDLILPADIDISDAEAAPLLKHGASIYRDPTTGKYRIELEVFHSLHCLNMLRMRIYSEQYPDMLTENARIHVDHCIESLRELIMCEGNMTPIPIEWSELGGRINPNYAQKHSCRDFNALKAWTRARAAAE